VLLAASPPSSCLPLPPTSKLDLDQWGSDLSVVIGVLPLWGLWHFVVAVGDDIALLWAMSLLARWELVPGLTRACRGRQHVPCCSCSRSCGFPLLLGRARVGVDALLVVVSPPWCRRSSVVGGVWIWV
jgi:hypothetical protein